jgi:hypothetical protein
MEVLFMAQMIQFKRGVQASIPASAEVGEPLFCTDSNKLYIGTGTGVALVTGEDRFVKVGEAGTPDYLNSNYFEQDETNHIRIKQTELLTGVNADKVDGKNVSDAEVSTDYLWTAGKVISYVESFVNGLDWQNSVKSIEPTDVDLTYVAGDRFLVSSADGAGSFEGHENEIAVCNGPTHPTLPLWSFITPNEGYAMLIEEDDKQMTFNGTAWVLFGSLTNHNVTSGLQGGTTNEYYHLTSAQHSGLTGSNATTLHKHNTDNLDEGTTNLFFTDARARAALSVTDTNSIDLTYSSTTGAFSADLRSQSTNTITLAVDASGLKADLKTQDSTSIDFSVDSNGLKAEILKQNTNSINLGIDASGLKAELNTQDSNSIDFSIDASGLKADVVIQDTNTIDLGIDASGLKADIKKQDSDSITFSVDASGLKADVNVDNSTIKVDATNNYIYVSNIDGGSFA